MQIVRTILQLLHRKVSERSIAKEVKVSRNTVRKYDAASKSSSYSLKELLALDDATLTEIIYPAAATIEEPKGDLRLVVFEQRRDYFLKELKRTGVTKHILWEEYRQDQPEGYGYSQFCERLRRYQLTSNVSMRIKYKAGDTIMIDFAGDKLSYTDRTTGEVIYCQVLVCVLPFSGYSYVEALPNATLPQLVKGLNNCLRFFGGAPLVLIADNMKQVVTKSCKYEPLFTHMITDWSLHNKIHLKAARVRKPRDKPHVENEVKITYNRIYAPLRDKVFHSLAELNKAIVQLSKRHHKQAFQKKDYSRMELFTQSELPLLQPLPSEPYVMKHATQATVQRDYHVMLGEDRHYYSVPYTYVGKRLQIVYDTDHVEIYYQHLRITQHVRNYRRYDSTTKTEHMPDGHKSYHEQRGWDKQYFLTQADKIGPFTRFYMERMMDNRAFKEHAYKSCMGILKLSKNYPPSRMEAACKRAAKSNSTSYKTIQNILLHNLDSLEYNDQQTLPFTLPPHDNLRGSAAYS